MRMEILENNVRLNDGRLHSGLPSPLQLNALKESPHERKLCADGRNQKFSQKSKFPLLKNPGIHTGEAELILAALTGGGLTKRKVSGSLPSFLDTDRNVEKPGIKYKVGINGINHGQRLESKASGGEKTQRPGVENRVDTSDIFKVVTRAVSGRKKGGWQYKKKAGSRLIDLNVEFWLQRFADATTIKDERAIELSPAEETQDFQKMDELEKRDDRIPLNPEVAILEESIRKRLAVKSITEQLMEKQGALLAAARKLMDDKMLDNDTMREFLINVDSSEAEAHLLAIGQPGGEPSVIFKSETTTHDKGWKKRRGYFEYTSDGDGEAEPVPGLHEGSVISTGYKPSTARSEWSIGYKPLSARSGWSLGYKPSSARSAYFSEATTFHKSEKFGELTRMHKELLILKQQLQFSRARSCNPKQRIALAPTPTKTVNQVPVKGELELMPATYRAFHTEHLPNRQGLVTVPYLEKTSVQQGREKQKFQLPRLQLSGIQLQRESLYLGTISSSRYGIVSGSSQRDSPRKQHTKKVDISPHKYLLPIAIPSRSTAQTPRLQPLEPRELSPLLRRVT